MKRLLSAPALSLIAILALGACSPAVDDQSADSPLPNVSTAATPSATDARPPASNSAEPAAPTPSPAPSDKVIGLEGLGTLRLGQKVPPGGSWAERGAQTGEACRTVSSPDYPGVYAMVIGGKVRRITIGQRSDVKLVEGVGVGATERDVTKWFAGFRAEPHKYEAAPAKYLTAPNAASGDPAVRFEIGQDGKVKMIHVGMMPELAYVEGCA